LRIVLVLFLFQLTWLLGATSRKDDLLRRRERISIEIATTESLLKKLDVSRSEVINSLSLINRKIALRRELIENLNAEVTYLDASIDSISLLLERNQQFIERTKKEYANVVYRSYFYIRPNSMLLLLFSSPSLGVMYRRYVYLRQYHEHRRLLISTIRREVNSLFENTQRLAQTRAEKVRLINLRHSEVLSLNKDLATARVSLKEVQKRSRELQKSLENLRSSARKIEEEIRKLVESEVQKAKTSTAASYSRQVAALSARFEQNKGRLPFPVQKGVVISGFGEQSHPLYRGIKIFNNGVDISTECDAAVYSVFNGMVSKVFFIKGSNYAVILRHGNFYTVYQNLSRVEVAVGMEVESGKTLGYTSCVDGETVARLHFEIWQDLQKLDPLLWLAR